MKQATLDLAIRCIDYLCQRHHDLDLTREELSEKVMTGQYSFHAFSTRMWFDLACQHLRLIDGANLTGSLANAIEMLWEARKAPDFGNTNGSETQSSRNESGDQSELEIQNDINQHVFQRLLENQPSLHQILCEVSKYRTSSFSFTGRTNAGRIGSWKSIETHRFGRLADIY